MTVNSNHHRFGRSCAIILSISPTALPLALLLNNSNAFTSLAFDASSPALTTMPHFTHISIRSVTGRVVHLGMNVEASFVLPAPRICVKNGCIRVRDGHVSWSSCCGSFFRDEFVLTLGDECSSNVTEWAMMMMMMMILGTYLPPNW